MKHSNIKERMIEGITTHVCTSKKNNFPRSIGFPRQQKVNDTDEFFDQIFKRIEYSNCYSSLFSAWQVQHQIYDKLYIDIDSLDLIKAYKEMQKVNTYFIEYFNCNPRIIFTANKGFAIYCDYPESHINFLKGYSLVIHLMAVLKLKCIDLKVSRDFNRITRIPYSLNFNTLKCNNELKLCVPIDPSWSLHEIIVESKNCKFRKDIVIEPNKEIVKILKSIQLPKYDEVQIKQRQSTYRTNNEQINNIVNNGNLFTDGRHRILCKIIIPYMVQEKNTDDEIVQTCSEFLTNSNKNIQEYIVFIKYHITRNRERKYRPKTISELLVDNVDIQQAMK